MIKLIVLDVDGTLTDGKIYYSNSLEEIKGFDVKDGLAITSWHKLGFKTAIITGRESKIVQKRADELGISYVFQGIKNKIERLKYIANQENISLDEIAVIGDDLNDISMMREVGISFCPSNASKFVLQNVDVILHQKGGDGAVREMVEYIVDKFDLQEEFLSVWV